MNIKLIYDGHPANSGNTGMTFAHSDADRPEDKPIESDVRMHRFSGGARRGKPWGYVKITGGNASRVVSITSTQPHKLRMLAADLNKLAAWLESPNTGVPK